MKKKINNFFLRCFHLADYRLSTLAAVKLDDQSRFFFLPFIRCQGQLESFLAELGARGQTTFQIIIREGGGSAHASLDLSRADCAKSRGDCATATTVAQSFQFNLIDFFWGGTRNLLMSCCVYSKRSMASFSALCSLFDSLKD